MKLTKEELAEIHERAIMRAYAPAALLEELKHKKLLSAKEASALYGISESTLAKRRMEGLPPVFFKIGGSVKYRQEDLEQFVNICTQKTAH